MERIFEAIQFKLAKEVIPSKDLDKEIRFQYRGNSLNMSLKHQDIDITYEKND